MYIGTQEGRTGASVSAVLRAGAHTTWHLTRHDRWPAHRSILQIEQNENFHQQMFISRMQEKRTGARQL